VLGAAPPAAEPAPAGALTVARTRVRAWHGDPAIGDTAYDFAGGPSSGNMFYNVAVTGVSLGPSEVSFSGAAWDGSYGTVLDSGTTFSYLPATSAASFQEMLEDVARGAGFGEIAVAGYGFCFRACAPALPGFFS
jgi:Xylanase inhibitor C-terminal